MSRPAKADEIQVGAALVEAFREAGYAGSSMRTLGAATGLTSSSLYHRFAEGKESMGCAALAYAGADFAKLVLAPLQESGPPQPRLDGAADGLRRFYADGSLACLLAVFALSDAPAVVRKDVRAAFASWREALAEVLGLAGATDPPAEAEDRIAAVQGALILARAGEGNGAFDRAVNRLARLP